MKIWPHIFLYGVGLILALPGMLNAQAPKPFELKDVRQASVIGQYIMYLEDPLNNFTIDSILTLHHQKHFVQNDYDVFSNPAWSGGYWFQLTVSNKTNEDMFLEIGTTYAWYIDFYVPSDSGGYILTHQTGTMRPNENKVYDINLFWLPLNKAYDDSAKTYYVYIRNGLTYEVPMQIGTIRSLYKNKTYNDLLTGAFLGIMLIMLLYNGFIYLSIRDKVYIYYLGYLLIMMVSMPWANGYPFIQEFSFGLFDKQDWNEYFLFWHPFVYLFVGLFCIHYLELRTRAPIIFKVLLVEMVFIASVYPVLTLAGFRMYELVNSFQVSLLLFYLTCWISGIYIIYKKFRTGYYYIAAWTFMIGGAFVFFATINGYLPFTPFTRNALYFGISIEVWMFSLALGNKLNTLMHEKELAQAENIKLLEVQNITLERKVEERTTNLQETNNKLMLTVEELNALNEELKLVNEQLDMQSEQLRGLNKNKDKIFAIISHDLRAPVGSIKNFLELLSNHDQSSEIFFENLPLFKNSVENVYFTLFNLLHWANNQMKGFYLATENVKIYDLINENIGLVDFSLKAKKIQMQVLVKPELEFLTDKNYLNVLIRNFLSNAVKYTPIHGEITISAKTNQNELTLQFKDTGIGMDNDTIVSIFKNKDYTQSRYGTQGEKGIGIGLMLCMEIVNTLNGQINVESIPNFGTAITLKLPEGEILK